jgi:hypothetical protein
MSYSSPLYENEIIIDESTPIIGGGGLELPTPHVRKAFRAGNTGFCKSFDIPTFSREEIRERIKEREQRGAILSQIVKNKKIPTSDQNGINFCWTYGVVTAVNVMRALRSIPYVEFSRESVAAPVKGYRNNGGWGDEALQYMVKVGIMPQSLWPKHYYQSNKYNTPDNLAVAAKYKIDEFLIFESGNFLQQMTGLLLDYPLAMGLSWWSHEICGIDPVIIGSTDLGIRIWNSWTETYGTGGMSILSESKATADDCVSPVTQTLTE